VSCPSCGRTLFDLQEVTEQIRQRTGHLPGVSIAVMGCIVNGPGEMADADFGCARPQPHAPRPPPGSSGAPGAPKRVAGGASRGAAGMLSAPRHPREAGIVLTWCRTGQWRGKRAGAGARRYVGGAPDKIDLYVGKEVVRRGIPMDGACDQLIELIKEHDRWQEKEVEEEPAGEREPQLA